mmetsp:Transcript_52407/g.131736  ORF Transcript_52407/g.131736 Transcript_52407/m.131736 type:complete len:234 (-) Transcript_52407:957-1658(-)
MDGQMPCQPNAKSAFSLSFCLSVCSCVWRHFQQGSALPVVLGDGILRQLVVFLQLGLHLHHHLATQRIADGILCVFLVEVEGHGGDDGYQQDDQHHGAHRHTLDNAVLYPSGRLLFESCALCWLLLEALTHRPGHLIHIQHTSKPPSVDSESQEAPGLVGLLLGEQVMALLTLHAIPYQLPGHLPAADMPVMVQLVDDGVGTLIREGRPQLPAAVVVPVMVAVMVVAAVSVVV